MIGTHVKISHDLTFHTRLRTANSCVELRLKHFRRKLNEFSRTIDIKRPNIFIVTPAVCGSSRKFDYCIRTSIFSLSLVLNKYYAGLGSVGLSRSTLLQSRTNSQTDLQGIILRMSFLIGLNYVKVQFREKNSPCLKLTWNLWYELKMQGDPKKEGECYWSSDHSPLIFLMGLNASYALHRQPVNAIHSAVFMI